jgi:predicted dehydrogenase/threonine dehydrogenase-like Zn-dependent dehydrogenase
MKTVRQVKSLLEEGKPTGYSLSGMVIGCGEGVRNFKIGDRVAAAGGGFANHAEYVDVPEMLVVKIPGELGFAEASTVTLGAIAMHSVRRASLAMGEFGVVLGTGILGLLTVQLLKVTGVRVIAIDTDAARLSLARDIGAEAVINPASEDPVTSVLHLTNGHGADAVIFAASTTSSEPLSQAFQMCRRKGKVVLLGTAGMEVSRKDIYPKEIDLLISTSYGPGRYDKEYEEYGNDYPYPYVRWTENRNLEEYLRLLQEGKVDVKPMISKIFPFEQVSEAFEALHSTASRPVLIILDYGGSEGANMEKKVSASRKVIIDTAPVSKGAIGIALIGAGGFATSMHLPNLEKLKTKFSLRAVVDTDGPKAMHVAKMFHVAYSTTEITEVLKDPEVTLALICTRHANHAGLVLQALEHGKHVFVEKPLATTPDDLYKIRDFYSQGNDTKPMLMVGFNRRFSPLIKEISHHTGKRLNPLFIRYRMNAGYMPPDHWVYEQGGRIVGEACHIIDLMGFLTQSTLESIQFESLTPSTKSIRSEDNKTILLKYKDGSMAGIDYIAVGNNSFPKECMEIHFDGKSIVLNDYRQLDGYGLTLKNFRLSKPDKGHFDEWLAVHQSLSTEGSPWPIPLEELLQTTEATFMAT